MKENNSPPLREIMLSAKIQELTGFVDKTSSLLEIISSNIVKVDYRVDRHLDLFSNINFRKLSSSDPIFIDLLIDHTDQLAIDVKFVADVAPIINSFQEGGDKFKTESFQRYIHSLEILSKKLKEIKSLL
jgi:hypothetical protein